MTCTVMFPIASCEQYSTMATWSVSVLLVQVKNTQSPGCGMYVPVVM